MKDAIQARIEFIHNAKAGKYSREQAESVLDQMEQQYGEDAFLPGKVVKKPRPWTRKDLDELEMEAVGGGGSREFLQYLAEMGEEVSRKERQKRQIKIVGLIGVVIVVIVTIIVSVYTLRN